MDAVEFLKEKYRMCKKEGRFSCGNCKANKFTCDGSFPDEAERLVEIVEKWAKEHPTKTRAQDFFEKHPNAPSNANGSPEACAGDCGYCGDHNAAGHYEDCGTFNGNCFKCWKEEV